MAEELTGGHWRTTDDGDHIYIKGGEIVAGLGKQAGKGPLSHVVHKDGSVTTASGVHVDRAQLVKAQAQSGPFLPEHEVRPTDATPGVAQKAKEEYRKHEKEFAAIHPSSEEKAVAKEYFGSSRSADINNELRGLNPYSSIPKTTENLKVAHHIQSMVNRAPPTSGDMVVYRAAKLDEGHKEGETFSHRSFFSSSTLPSDEFVSNIDDAGKGAIYEVHVPKGSTGVLRGMNPDETEVLLGRGSHFTVKSVTTRQFHTSGGVKTLKVYQVRYRGA